MDRSQRSTKGKGEGEGRKGKTAKDAMEIEEVDGEEGEGESEEEAGPDASQLPGTLRFSWTLILSRFSALAPYCSHEVPNLNHFLIHKRHAFLKWYAFAGIIDGYFNAEDDKAFERHLKAYSHLSGRVKSVVFRMY
jgi:hypothetical protein